MIRNFWVKNYLSIRDKQELSFIAKGPESELVTEITKDVFLYKLCVLFGSNASGKSNLLYALNEVFKVLVLSKTDANKKIKGAIPFIQTKDEPVEMFVSFYANSIRYDYEVAFNEKYVLKEILNYYPNNTKSLFYERYFVGENIQASIKIGPSLKLLSKTQDSIKENTLNNHSVLSVCAKAAFKEDIAPFNSLYGWIMKNYHEIDGDNDENKGIVEQLKEAYSDPIKRKYYNIMLNKADLNIIDYHPIIEDRIIPNALREAVQKNNFPDEIKEAILKPTTDSIVFSNYSCNGSFDVPIKWQSKGTIQYLKILDALYDMITGSHVYFLDELGEDLHSDLLYYYLNTFIYNSKNSQLIITSQEITLLAQDLVNENRGMVWFVEKNKETASSEYSRGDSFGLHKNLSLYNSYRIGRLGAKPELGSFFIDLDN